MPIDNLPGRITLHAEHTPEKIAIEYGARHVSYQELEEATNRIALFLAERLKENKNVLVMLERSPELIAAMLGIIKSGGLFVPLDLKYPANRIKFMVEEVDAHWMIVRRSELKRFEEIVAMTGRNINPLVLEDVLGGNVAGNALESASMTAGTLNRRSSAGSSADFDPATLNKHCYIYFTSGSTGTPKGILGRQRSLLHFLDWEIKEFGVTPEFRHSQFVAPAFDPFLRDVLVPLLQGATLCIPESEEIILDPRRMAQWLGEQRIDFVHMTPSLFKNLSGAIDEMSFAQLKYILLAGEMLRGNDLHRWFTRFGERIQLVNLYGPTETTLAKFFYRVQKDDVNNVNIPVGKPIPGAECLILDKEMMRCRDGWIGEVYIRTPFISSGYYNHPELTREVFMRNPFTNNPQDIIYKTGDLGRIKADGNLELVGRQDFQIKVRGVRVEPGEIENHLLKYPRVKEAVVMGREDKAGEMYLAAYYLADVELPPGELRQHLALNLTDAMIPAYFVHLESLPMTPNGKIDRKALPEPDLSGDTSVQYVPPTTDTEKALVLIWSEVLGHERIGVLDNFFALGGHSLKATALLTRVARDLRVDIPLRQIFQSPTIRELAAYIDSAQVSHYASIKRVEDQLYYPVSAAQKRLYVLYELDGNSTGYNMPRAMIVEGAFDRQRFAMALNELIQRHESLRTSFELIQGEIVQHIHSAVSFTPLYREVEERELAGIVQEFIQPFNLQQAPLFRAGLIKFSDKYLLLFDVHHIVADGLSMGIITRDFIQLYAGDRANCLPEMKIQYRDFAIWQNQLLESKIYQQQEEYWLQEFADEVPVLHLPTDYSRPALNTYAGDHVELELGKELTAQLQTLAMKNGATLFMVLLAAYVAFLHRESGQEDIVVGTPIAGRAHGDLTNLIGMFVNTLALRNTPKPENSFRELLLEVRENTLKAFENQDYQFDMLVDKLGLARDLSRNPLFDVMFSLHNVGAVPEEAEGLHFQPYPFANLTAKFDMEMKLIELAHGKNYLLDVEYSTQLFKRETVERMVGHFLNLLRSAIENPDTTLAELEILSAEEKYQLIDGFNSKQVPLDTQYMIHQLIERNAAAHPERIAVTCAGETLTYKALNERANQLARVLRKAGIGRDQLAGILMQRSLTMVISILAVWKAGGAYIPLDPAYPAQRIVGILDDAAARVLLTLSEYANADLANFTGTLLDIEAWAEEILKESTDNLSSEHDMNDLAYVIYTSGSTGKPKGAMVEQIGMLNHMYAKINDLQLTEECIVSQNSSHCFDISVWQFFVALVVDGQTVIYPNELTLDPEGFITQVIADEVTILEVVPSYLATMLDFLENKYREFPALDYLLVTGEAVKPSLVRRWFKSYPGIKMVNAYGPTEASDDITHFIMDQPLECEQVPIGQPVQNFHIYIVDQQMRLCPIGVKGEICVSGIGVGRGYLNDPEKTANVFLEDPFARVSGVRLYKTGDLGRWLPDGTIEFFGRKDYQVKIRGFRIELGEIENKLVKHPAIKEAVVIDRLDGASNKYLCAYIVTDPQLANSSAAADTATTLSTAEIRAFLANELPEYMIPSFFVTLPHLPLNPNGKIDRKALPEPDGQMEREVAYVAPETALEKALVSLWSEVLGGQQIGLDDNFFELGGDSIKAIQLIAKANERGLHFSVRDIFQWKTIAALVENVQNLETETEPKSLARTRAGKSFAVTHQYPEYYDCLIGATLEKLKYDANYHVPHGFLPASDGRGLVGYVDLIEQEGGLQYIVERSYGLLTGFPTHLERYGLGAEMKQFESFEAAEEYLRQAFAANTLVMMRGVTYHMNFTPEYHNDALWREKVDADPTQDHGHIFLVISETARGYMVYDIAYNYYGEVFRDDLAKAFAGLGGIAALKNHPAQAYTRTNRIIELDTTNLKRLEPRELGHELLQQYVNAYLQPTPVNPGCDSTSALKVTQGDVSWTVHTGLQAFKAMADDLQRHRFALMQQGNLQQILTANLQAFKNSFVTLYDFLIDCEQYAILPVEVINDVEKACWHFSQLVEECKNTDKAAIAAFTDKLIADLQEIFAQQSQVFEGLKAFVELQPKQK